MVKRKTENDNKSNTNSPNSPNADENNSNPNSIKKIKISLIKEIEKEREKEREREEREEKEREDREKREREKREEREREKREREEKEKEDKKESMILFNIEIKSIDDLIYLGEQYVPGKKYNINIEKLNNLLPTLKKLQQVIGMTNVKKSIVNQIIYFIQDFQDKNSDMLHTVIQGPPGVGKTMLGQIIGEIYHYLDIIESSDDNKPQEKNIPIEPYFCQDDFCEHDNDECPDYYDYEYNNKKKSSNLKKKKELKFIIAKRSDLIGKYLGHTAAKTQEIIDKALGGVLFIDEAYSLGNPEGRDSFSKECIDTINQNLTEKKNKLLVIIAGYKGALDTCFFSYNEGLRRRFPFVYTIEKYESSELSQILKKMIKQLGDGWEVDTDVDKIFLDKFFDKNNKMFPNSAGDIETLVFNIKIEHSKRVFCCLPGSNERKKINKLDIENALLIYKVNMEKKEQKVSDTLYNMYV